MSFPAVDYERACKIFEGLNGLNEEAVEAAYPVKWAVLAAIGEKEMYSPFFVSLYTAVETCRMLWVFLGDDLARLIIYGPSHVGEVSGMVGVRDMLAEFVKAKEMDHER